MKSLKDKMVDRSLLETATGMTCEVTDPWGNVAGFAGDLLFSVMRGL